MRRRRKSSSMKSLMVWTVCLALLGWSTYQAALFWRALPAKVTDDPGDGGAAAGGAGEEAAATMGRPSLGLGTTTNPDAGGDIGDYVPSADMMPYPTFDEALTAEELHTKGMQLLDSGDVVAARFTLNAALARSTGEEGEARAAQLRPLLSRLNTPVFLSSAVLPDDPAARLIEIQENDNFTRIARGYGLTVQFLQTLNPGLRERRLLPHTGVKIVQGPFHARIVKQVHRLDLYARDLYVTSFRVDFPEGNSLPTGEYVVSDTTKLQLGTWPLMRTWIGFHGAEDATEEVSSGWIFGSAGPRGRRERDLATGIQLADADMETLYLVLTEEHSYVRVEP
jgi:hypothetical protein